MSRQKIHSHMDTDDYDDILKPCFQISSDVKLKDIPSTGEEYLLKVKNEREKTATVTRSKEDYSKFAENQNCFVTEIPLAKVCDKLKPTIEWQNMQVADFSDIRMYVSRMRAKKKEYSHKIKKLEHTPQSVKGWRMFFTKTEPTLSCLLGFKNAVYDLGLENIIELLDDVKPGDTIDQRTGQWIYALLTCIIQPLLSDTTSILRDLARKCAEIRSHIDPDDSNAAENVAPMNIFICLVGRYFRQYDLAD